jgi:hypothetical protein
MEHTILIISNLRKISQIKKAIRAALLYSIHFSRFLEMRGKEFADGNLSIDDSQRM